MGESFILLAGCTSFDVITDPLVYSGLVGVFFCCVNSFISTGVPGQGVVVY